MKWRFFAVFLTTALTSSFLVISCGGSSSSSAYKGPGSDYTITLSGSNFTLTEATASLNIQGTFSELNSGFLELTVVTSSGTGAPSPGDKAYGLFVEGFVFFLKPLSGDQLITMLKSGSCPTTDMSLNWIMGKLASGQNPYSGDIFGTFSHNVTTGDTSLPSKYALNATTTNLGTETLGTFDCADGVATVSSGGGGGTAKMYFTSAGGAIVNTNTEDADDSQFVIATATQSLSATSDLDGEYAGLVFIETGDVGAFPVTATFNGATIEFQQVNPATNATSGSAETAAIGTLNSPSNGFFVITFSSGSRTAICSAMTNVNSTGKNVILCAGNPPGGAQTEYFSAIFVSNE